MPAAVSADGAHAGVSRLSQSAPPEPGWQWSEEGWRPGGGRLLLIFNAVGKVKPPPVYLSLITASFSCTSDAIVSLVFVQPHARDMF